jgi:hypothetical protein
MTVPAPERRGRLSRFQKVATVTGVAAVGATALALTVVPARGEGGVETTSADLPADAAAWRTAVESPDAQKSSIDSQTDRAIDRALAQEREAARKKAAAKAKHERAAEKAHEEARKREHAKEAGRSSQRKSLTSASPSGSPQQIARQIVGDAGQFECFSHIVERESGWDIHAQNPSGAYGLLQALPGSKMSSAGPDWRNNAATQVEWGLDYMKDRYGSACGAWSFWQSHNWY